MTRTTCPRDCYDACGIVVEQQDGRVTKVSGDPEHPVSRGSLCGKCAVAYNGSFIDPAARLLHPLRRNGAKGGGAWTSIGWDEALAEIAARLHPLIGTAAAARVLQTHYTGTVSLLAGNFPLRFFNAIGATEVDPDTVCNKAGHAALQLVFGDSLRGFDPRTVSDATCIVVWGANPSACAPHTDRFWLGAGRATRIVIDPIRHRTASKADLHLQPRPGSDAALAFAMLHAVRAAGLLDRAFIAQRTLGWDAIEAQLEACSPEWGESVTGVPASLIREAAEIYAKGPSLLWLGQGLQRQPYGGNVFRACSLLPAATGNLGKPGAGFLYLNGLDFRGIDVGRLTGSALTPGAAPSVSHMDLPDILNDPARSSALFTWNCNPAASSPNQSCLIEGLRRDDLFHVAIDLFPTDTVSYADIVLPAASFLEFNDVVLSYFDWTVSAQVRVADPMGESLPNSEIFRRLAKACGLTVSELFADDRTLIEELLAQTAIGLDFPALANAGTVAWRKDVGMPFADGGFATPSGRIELAGDAFIAAGLPAAPMPHADEPPPPGSWRVLSPASSWLMNSSFGNEGRVRQELGPQTAFLHPAFGAAAGLAQDDEIVLRNATGALRVRVGFDDGVPAATILLHKGRWLKHEPAGRNVNVLNPGLKTDLAQSSSVHGIEVRVERCAS